MRKVKTMVVMIGCVCAVGAALWWLHITQYHPWEYRPFGDLYFYGGWGPGYVHDIKEKERLLLKSRSPNPDERANAARRLGAARYNQYEPEVAVVIGLAVADEDESVRVAAIKGLGQFLMQNPRGSDEAIVFQVVRVLSWAMIQEPSVYVRELAMTRLCREMPYLQRKMSHDFYVSAHEVVSKYLKLASRDPAIKSLAQGLLAELPEPDDNNHHSVED